MSAQVSPSSASAPSLPTLPNPLKAERIQLWLRGMPGWKVVARGLQIQRQFIFRTRCESLSFLRHAVSAAEAVEVPFGLRGPVIEYRGDRVTVSIWSHRGVFSGPDLEVARVVSQPN
ncbi:MAG TPA: 4a-hydroxytetrahydrobiopterin dehydratase [Thermoanaerobaculia bacterium]|jgi:pterin-4a-carbinolamine dehydratase|nr:4a-hydroxytetrahydrobiopterin dehydratase [Thermoanaerobaculia bacterium]